MGTASRTLGRACLVAIAAAASPARAQTVNSGVGLGPSEQVARPVAPPAVNVAPDVEHLFGEPGDLRARLAARGVVLLLDAISEFAGNVDGGTRRGATFANQVGFEADLDWGKLAGIAGLATHVIVVQRSGSSDSQLFGDDLEPVQEIYGSGGNVGAHLVSAYAQETLPGRRLDVAVGRMNVENDFASSPLYCNYMNNTLCGDPKALPGGDIGHSAYPDAAWAARLRLRPTARIYVQAGIYEVNQDLYRTPHFRSGFEFDDAADSGVYLPVELGFEPILGTAGLPGHYKLGLGHDTSGTFLPFAAALAPGVPAAHRTGNTQLWVLADQMLLRRGAGDANGVVALAGFTHNDPTRSSYADEFFAGLLDRGVLAARPGDTLAVLFSLDTVSGDLRRVQLAELASGLPVSGDATGPQRREVILEADYDIHVARGVNIQPDLQYVVDPNAQRTIRDATVLGFKAHVEF